MNRGKWIVVNGADGTGKTTQEAILLKKNPSWKTVREPGGTILGELVREILLSDAPLPEFLEKLGLLKPFVLWDAAAAPLWFCAKRELEENRMTGLAEMYLYALSRLWSTRQVYEWIQQGYTVVSTRSVACSFAYQAWGRELGEDVVHMANQESMNFLSPDVEIFLEVSPEVAGNRKNKRDEQNRFDRETDLFFKRVESGYHSYYTTYAKHPVVRIDAEGSVDDVAEMVEEVLKAFSSF